MKIRSTVSNNLFFIAVLLAWVALMPGAASGSVCYRFAEGYLVSDDWDGDGVLDEDDACPQSFDPDMDDYDSDGVGDVCDSCPLVRNQAQSDVDWDGIGDACDDDIDGDMVLNPRGLVVAELLDTATDTVDSATLADTADTGTTTVDSETDTGTGTDGMDVSTETETETETDSATGAGTDDAQSDTGMLQALDNCPLTYNPRQEDQNGDGEGDACDPDLDGDGVVNELDFCPFDSAVSAYVNDAAHATLQCLGDSDADGVLNYHVVNGVLLPLDNCQYVVNPDQADLDGDGIGDECDNDVDGDNVVDSSDNCTYNNLFNDIVADIEEFHATKESASNGNMCAIESENFNAGDINGLSAQEKAAAFLSAMSKAELLGYLQNTSQEDFDRDRLGDACDRNFCQSSYPFEKCYVVFDDEANCLDIGIPQIKVYSPRVVASNTSDDPIRLRIFANRENERLLYIWSMVQGDLDGIELHNARGEVNCSSGYEYHYRAYNKNAASGNDATEADDEDIVDMSATYETHLEGSYTLRLSVYVLDADGNPIADDPGTKNIDEAKLNFSEAYVTVNASGSDDYIADSCGCEVVGHPGTGSWGWLLLALMIALALRRRLLQL